jgi:hypothetical protein
MVYRPLWKQRQHEDKVVNVQMWVDAVGRMTNLRIGHIVERLENEDEDLIDAIDAVLESAASSWDKLDALKNFLVQQLLAEPDPQPFVTQTRGISPFDVPQGFLERFFHRNGKEPWPYWGVEVRQFYDSIELNEPSGLGLRPNSSIRMFGNANIGSAQRTNLQVAGQFCFSGQFLATNWWITAPDVEHLEMLLAASVVQFEVGDKPMATLNALTLHRERQALFVPIPVRQNICVRFDHHQAQGKDEPVWPEARIPIFVYIEGWAQREVR